MLDIIIPVYAGEAVTRRCIDSVLAATCITPCSVLVVDDCSPEPALSAWLESLAVTGRIELLRNARNLGFVGSVNRALAVHPERDVVLLNSDTEVAGDWLDRLAGCAEAHPEAATLTPLSNNATICSYPYEGWMGGVPGTLGLAGLDALIARRLPGVVADLPTGVGFCMFIRRDCLARVGGLDEQAFGRGYGEENDLCRRAAKAGWRNLLCADVFVFHQGSVSFGAGRHELMREGARALRRLHPEYDGLVRRFIEADPLRPLREAIDAARRQAGAAEAQALMDEQAAAPRRALLPPLGDEGDTVVFNAMEAVTAPDATAWMQGGTQGAWAPVCLHVTHSWGGGVERWVQDMAAADGGGRALLLRSRSARNCAGVRLELVEPSAGGEVLLAWDLVEAIDTCAIHHARYREIIDEVLAGFGVEAVIVSSLIGHALDVFEQTLPTVLVLHDMFPFCPALFGCFGGECTQCERARLAECFATNPHNAFWHRADVDAWQAVRAACARAIGRPNVSIAAPSRSVLERYAQLFPVLRSRPARVIPHGLHDAPARHHHRRLRAGGAVPARLRVLVPGRLHPHKGLDLLRALMPALAEFADVMLLGCGDFGRAFEQWPHVQVVVDYSRAQMPAHVAAFDPDCALLLSTLPETFSYTLSEMQALGIPIVATALGAFVERIQDGEDGFLVAPTAMAVEARLRALATSPDALTRVARFLGTCPVRTARRMLADYLDLIGLRTPASAPASASASASAPVARMNALLGHALADARARQRYLHALRQREGDAAWCRAAHLAWQRDQLEARIAGHEAEIGELHRRLRDAEQAQAAMAASRSWTLTAPLRAFARRLGRAAGPPIAGDPPEAPRPPQALRLFEQGDCVARRRVRRLAEHIGNPGALGDRLPVEEGAGGLGRPWADAGFTGWSLADAEGDVFCLGSVPEDALLPVLAMPRVDRIVVPTRAIAHALGIAQPGLQDRIVEVAYPLAGDWGGAWRADGQARRQARRQCRETLGVPDDARIVLGVGRGDGRSGLPAFAQAAMHTGECCNGVAFVWLGALERDWAASQGDRLTLPMALRRLFIVETDDFERWMCAADLYLGCCSAQSSDGAAVEALACGLAVAVLDVASLPARLSGRVSLLDGGQLGVARLLLARALPAREDDELLARCGSPAAWRAFAQACACETHGGGRDCA
jgi:GT2 family glycosyltransferase/glycosyltransferase involved in cell wall biosynthesis